VGGCDDMPGGGIEAMLSCAFMSPPEQPLSQATTDTHAIMDGVLILSGIPARARGRIAPLERLGTSFIAPSPAAGRVAPTARRNDSKQTQVEHPSCPIGKGISTKMPAAGSRMRPNELATRSPMKDDAQQGRSSRADIHVIVFEPVIEPPVGDIVDIDL
jgi:hypothetical protein